MSATVDQRTSPAPAKPGFVAGGAPEGKKNHLAPQAAPAAGKSRAARPAQHAPNGRPIALASGMRYDQLLAYLDRRPTQSILEIGVARAANALRMLAYADHLGGAPQYVGIDLFDSISAEQFSESRCSESKRPASREATLAHLAAELGAAIAQRCYLFEGLSGEVLPLLKQQGLEYDLIFIDGGHDFASVSTDWKWASQLVAPGGVIVFDDFPNWGVRGAIAAIDRRHWRVRILEHIDVFHGEPGPDEPHGLRMHMLVEVTRK